MSKRKEHSDDVVADSTGMHVPGHKGQAEDNAYMIIQHLAAAALSELPSGTTCGSLLDPKVHRFKYDNKIVEGWADCVIKNLTSDTGKFNHAWWGCRMCTSASGDGDMIGLPDEWKDADGYGHYGGRKQLIVHQVKAGRSTRITANDINAWMKDQKSSIQADKHPVHKYNKPGSPDDWSNTTFVYTARRLSTNADALAKLRRHEPGELLVFEITEDAYGKPEMRAFDTYTAEKVVHYAMQERSLVTQNFMRSIKTMSGEAALEERIQVLLDKRVQVLLDKRIRALLEAGVHVLPPPSGLLLPAPPPSGLPLPASPPAALGAPDPPPPAAGVPPLHLPAPPPAAGVSLVAGLPPLPSALGAPAPPPPAAGVSLVAGLPPPTAALGAPALPPPSAGVLVNCHELARRVWSSECAKCSQCSKHFHESKIASIYGERLDDINSPWICWHCRGVCTLHTCVQRREGRRANEICGSNAEYYKMVGDAKSAGHDSVRAYRAATGHPDVW